MDFSVDTFLSATFTEQLDTKVVPVPAGEWQGQVKSINFKEGQIKNGENAGKNWLMISLMWDVGTFNPQISAITMREENAVRHEFFADVKYGPDGKIAGLDLGKGKNIQLGRVLDAVGLNNGQPWSPNMLLGRPAVVIVKHRADPADAATLYAEVGGVRKV